MTENEKAEVFVRELAKIIQAKQAKFEGFYILDAENYKRYCDVCGYFKSVAESNGGKVTYMAHDPKDVHGDISVEIPIISLYRDRLREFVEKLSMVDVFGVTPTANGKLLIDATVNFIWRQVPKNE